MKKLPDEVLEMINKKVQRRPSKDDSNFNFVHQEDVFDIANLAYSIGMSKDIKIPESNRDYHEIAMLAWEKFAHDYNLQFCKKDFCFCMGFITAMDIYISKTQAKIKDFVSELSDIQVRDCDIANMRDILSRMDMLQKTHC